MSSRPNIITILADDMGYGDFGAFSDGSARTPTLDRLMAESVCLTQHYAGSCVCAPARASFLTGRYPHRTGAIDTREVRGLDRLALREKTMGDTFRAAGYVTGLIGKWHLGEIDPRFHPNARGFDEFIGFRGGYWDYYDWRLDYNGSVRKSDGRYLTDLFTDEAVAFIERHQREPFLLHLAYNAPHFPYQAPEEEVRPFRESGRFSEQVSIIYGMIQRMDKGLARVLHALDRLGLAENTIVLFTSDNGPQFKGEDGESTERYNYGFKGAKGNVYEGGIRVPLLLRWPAGLDGGRRYHEMVHFCDWLPTLLGMAGIEYVSPLSLDGQDVLPALRGEAQRIETRRFWQWNRYDPAVTCNAAMRDGAWKLMRPVIPEAMRPSRVDQAVDLAFKQHPDWFTETFGAPLPERRLPDPPQPELYNLVEDPSEAYNLADKYPQRTRQMLCELETWFEEVEAERCAIDDSV
jgi:arylsulfatase A-like enzyme